jgi:hypothetical protein
MGGTVARGVGNGEGVPPGWSPPGVALGIGLIPGGSTGGMGGTVARGVGNGDGVPAAWSPPGVALGIGLIPGGSTGGMGGTVARGVGNGEGVPPGWSPPGVALGIGLIPGGSTGGIGGTVARGVGNGEGVPLGIGVIEWRGVALGIGLIPWLGVALGTGVGRRERFRSLSTAAATASVLFSAPMILVSLCPKTPDAPCLFPSDAAFGATAPAVERPNWLPITPGLVCESKRPPRASFAVRPRTPGLLSEPNPGPEEWELRRSRLAFGPATT